MTIENFVDEVKSFELEEIKEWELEKLIKYMIKNNFERVYITKNGTPYYVFNPQVIIEIFLNNKINTKVKDYITEPAVPIIEYDKHIINTYNYMRQNRIEHAAVVKNGVMIGEVNFNTLSLKISFIAIKDPLTNTYNEKYFNVLIEEYNEIGDEIGIIMLKVYNLSIYEGLYGVDFVKNVLREISRILRSSTRSVDFIFRNDNVFKILTFNNAEITMKIKHRIDERLSDFKIDDIKINFKTVATQVPELENNILLAVEELERKLIERD